MISAFANGVGTLFRGISDFFTQPRFWLYAFIPFLILLGFYLAIGWLLLGCVLPFLVDYLPQAPPESWMNWVWTPLRWGILITVWISLLLAGLAAACSLYEIFGALFFDRMVQRVEKERYGLLPVPLSTSQNLKFILQAVLFSLNTLWISIGAFLISFWVPFLGPFILIACVGYRFGLTCLFACAFARGMSIPQLKRAVKGDRLRILGFGMMLYLLLLIPFAGLFLLAGFSFGGIRLFHDHILPRCPVLPEKKI